MRILFILLFCLIKFETFSQTPSDSVLFSIHYIAQFKHYVESEKLQTEEKVLDVMAGGFTDFHGRWLRKRSELTDSVVKAGGDFNEIMKAVSPYPSPCQFYTVYQNYPQKGERLFCDRAAIKQFHYTEKIEPINWTLENKDSVIAEYACQSASCTFRGHHWTVYYTADIPYSVGPWNLSGLPGAVMYAKDESGVFVFDAIEVRAGNHLFKAPNLKKSQKCTRAELRQMQLNADKDPDGFMKRLTGYESKGYTADGKPIVYEPKTTLFMED